MGVGGGSRFAKGNAMNAGDLPGKDAVKRPAEVRGAIVAMKSGNADGAKGAREANVLEDKSREGTPPLVPATDRQGGEVLWQRCKAERGVWSQGMLEALERGIKGGTYFADLELFCLGDAHRLELSSLRS